MYLLMALRFPLKACSNISMCSVRLRPWPEPVEVLYFACVGMAAGSKIER